MTWVKLDTGFFNDPKILKVTTASRLLYIAGLCHSGAHSTDGVIEATVLPLLQFQTGATDPNIDELVNVGLWALHPEGFEVASYLEHQRSREQVERDRENARNRAARAREARAKSRRDAARSSDADKSRGDKKTPTPARPGYPQDRPPVPPASATRCNHCCQPIDRRHASWCPTLGDHRSERLTEQPHEVAQ